jgi:hypothetical protein
MGLDITAYKRLTPAENVEVDEAGYPVDWDRYVKANARGIEMIEATWPGRTEGLIPGQIYSFEDRLGFRAGSYGGYNRWRAWLARVAGYESDEWVWENQPEGPFVELINFSDCEGMIGSVVASKLARDFAEHEAKILADAEEPIEPYSAAALYRTWRQAFEMAADGGAVDFH